MFKVFVPLKNKKKIKGRWITHVTYPATGFPPYTREQATNVLKRFYKKSPWQESDHQECWAESNNERFTLHFPKLLV